VIPEVTTGTEGDEIVLSIVFWGVVAMVNAEGAAMAFGIRQVRRCVARFEALFPAPLTLPVRPCFDR